MKIKNYINQKKELYEKLLLSIDSEAHDEFQCIFSNLIQIINDEGIQKDREEFQSFLHLMNKISQNHHRYSQFFDKIERILTEFKEDIKQTFSNSAIFNIFKNNKRILLFLSKNQIITIDESIFKTIQKKSRNQKFYEFYFYPEIKNFYKIDERKKIEAELTQILGELNIDEFEEKRKIGENDAYICQLIRQDSVEKFISHINRTNISILSKISQSIFETNPFLIGKEPTLIEYASFFGSIQIIRYLQFNKVALNSTLWTYSIHSNNAILIHFLEENNCKTSINKCLEESIKCHHNEIAHYIYDNLIDEITKTQNLQNNFSENILSYSFHYYNYSFFPSEFDNHFIFLYLCKYNYIKLVKLLLESMKNELNYTVISKLNFQIQFQVIDYNLILNNFNI